MKSFENPLTLVKVDNVTFGFDGVGLTVLLVQHLSDAPNVAWSLPSGLLEPGASINANARRVLSENTGLDNADLYQFQAFDAGEPTSEEAPGAVNTIILGFFSLIRRSEARNAQAPNGCRTAWFPIEELPDDLTEQQREIIEAARRALKIQSRNEPLIFDLLEFRFSVSELQRVLEVINSAEYDRRNFYRKAIATGLLNPEGMSPSRAAHRPPQLFSFRRDLYNELLAETPSMDYPFVF